MTIDRAAPAVGGIRHEMKRSQQLIGLGGAVVGVGTGLWGAVRRTRGTSETPASADG